MFQLPENRAFLQIQIVGKWTKKKREKKQAKNKKKTLIHMGYIWERWKIFFEHFQKNILSACLGVEGRVSSSVVANEHGRLEICLTASPHAFYVKRNIFMISLSLFLYQWRLGVAKGAIQKLNRVLKQRKMSLKKRED